MNRLKSILFGVLLAATSIAAIPQNSQATEVEFEPESLNSHVVAFNNSKLVGDRQGINQDRGEIAQVSDRERRRIAQLRYRQRQERARELRERRRVSQFRYRQRQERARERQREAIRRDRRENRRF